MSADTLQQANMFTGAWETKRTPRSHLEQTTMFSINETFVFGERVRPWLSESAAPTLELIREDVRTPEEIERDLRRQAEALTTPMFASEAVQENDDWPEQQETDSEYDSSPPETLVTSEKDTKLSCYYALVNLAHEQAVTLWVDEAYRGRFYAQLPQAILFAKNAGLTAPEISAAMQIGEFQGKREREVAPQLPGVISGVSEPTTTTLSAPTPTSEASTERGGFRARHRQEHTPVRTRHLHRKTPEIVPGLWMEREHIRKRLPYLAEGIARLDEDELTSLVESISEALQASYWTILGIALAHYTDHEQRKGIG